MKKNFKLVVEYDGTDFFGWQRQENLPTIQGEIEKALSTILNQEIHISGSGRTDAGVHALGQVASFKAETDIDLQKLKKGVNSLIKHPIVVRELTRVNDDFHAQYKAISKEYHYVILNREDPCAVGRNFVWHIRHPLDVDRMNQCCALLKGEHDFKSFENTGSPRSSTIRKVFSSQVSSGQDHRLVFKICASGFLKNMVRNITGTLVDAGLSKIGVQEFKDILDGKDRTLAGATAPARGLFLFRVNY